MATGGQVLVEALKLAGIGTVFGLPGTQTLAAYDALRDEDSIETVFLRNEQSMSIAAKGYFQASSKVAACLTVPGPGATNMITGVVDALTDSCGMVLITTDIPKEHLGKGAVHECDLAGLFRPAVKSQLTVDTAEDLAAAVFQAAHDAANGRPGPVQILLSGQMLRADAGTALPQEEDRNRIVRDLETVQPPDPQLIREAAAALRNATKPLIYAGGGVSFDRAGVALTELAEKLGAPIVTSLAGRGVVREDHPLSVGVPFFPGVPELIEESDAALVIGTRFSEFATATWQFKLPTTTIRVDTDPVALELNYPATTKIQSTAGAAISALLNKMSDVAPIDTWQDSIQRVKAAQTQATDHTLETEAKSHGRVHPMDATRAMRRAMDEEAIITMDGSATEMWIMDPSFPVFAQQGFLCSEVFQEVGAALPAAIGAKIASRDRQVVCLSGDGGLMYSVGEFAALVSQGIAVKIVVFDDGGWYNSIRQFQDAFFDGRYIGTFLTNPEFGLVATGFGLPYFKARRAEEVEEQMRRLLAEPGPGLLVIEIDNEPLAPRFRVRIQERRKTL